MQHTVKQMERKTSSDKNLENSVAKHRTTTFTDKGLYVCRWTQILAFNDQGQRVGVTS